MDAGIHPVIIRIMNQYGHDVFYNMGRTNAMLLDLAPGMKRERIMVRNFVEIGGFKALQQSQGEYPLVKNNLIKSLTETFCLEASAAYWVVHIFGIALGYETEPLSDTAAAVVTLQRNSAVAIGKAHAVAVAADGTVFGGGVNTYYQCDVSGWRNIIAVAAGDAHTVGLKADGTVLATGLNANDQCDVGTKENVASLYAFGHDTICIHTDGTVTATGRAGFDLSEFNEIKLIVRYPEGLLGIRADGHVMASGKEEDEEINWLLAQEDVEQVISTYVNGSIILKKDGRLYKNNRPDNYFAPWQDIISMVDLSDSFAILRKDGTVRILSYEREQTSTFLCDAVNWGNVVALYGRYKRLIGLTADGQLLTACTDPDWLKRNGSLDFVKSWYPIGT